MPAVTQLVPNLLGGISKQSDDKKFPGQVVTADNAYPDPTFGMLKRNGMRFVRTINKADGTPFTEAELENAAWFFIQRGPTQAYFGAIKGTNIYVWNSITGALLTVNNDAADYLTGTKPEDYAFRTIQDVTVITNKTVNTKLLPAPTGFVRDTVGTVVVKNVEYSADYIVTINGTNYPYRTRNSDTFVSGQTDLKLNIDNILDGLTNALAGSGLTISRYETSLELSSSTPFEVEAKGGQNNAALDAYGTGVNNIARLPALSADGRYVEVLNSGGDEDNYWLQYKSATKEWKEVRSPFASAGLDPSTMPHELLFVDGSDTELAFQTIPWTEREAGDDVTNPPPSLFPYDEETETYLTDGATVNATFFYNNRFGLLSEDNVILSQVNDPFNFFARSAITQTISDPVDLNAASVRPVQLFDVLPDSQGLLLFSRRQQFLLFATDAGQITPRTAVIRGLANYEMDDNIPPVDIGTTVGFISKVPAYTRAFSMQTRGLEEPPIVLDLSKVISELLPSNITDLVSSPQNSFIALASRGSKDLYIYRYYNNGDEDLFQAWVKWTFPGDIQGFEIANDMMFLITKQEGQYTLGVLSINDIPLGSVFSGAGGIQTPDMTSPILDMAQFPDSLSYDAATNKTTINVGYKPLSDREAIMLLTPEVTQSTFSTTFDLATFGTATTDAGSEPGYWKPLTRGDGNFFEVEGDFSDQANSMIVGYNYNFELQLPTFYYNRSQDSVAYDFTANLNIARVKFSCGKSGAVSFKIKALGSEEWVDLQAVSDANYYEANSLPVEGAQMFTVPVNQRNKNFSLKISSELPFPVAVNSMMWEGTYTPRYYRRT